MTKFQLDDLYLSMIRHGRARMTDDIADLEAEFPAWDFGATWVTVGSGPDVRRLFGWPLDGGPTLTALDADEMRRKIRQVTQ